MGHSNRKHNSYTPGPWTVAELDRLYVNSPGGTIVIHPGGSYRAKIGELQANARLIAAAPELLEAGKEALAWWHSIPSNIEKKEPGWLALVRAAIRKAEGDGID